MLLDEKAYIAELERQNAEMLYAFDAMRQRAEAAEATGRAAVRALERLQPLVESRAAHLWHSGKTQTSVVWQQEAQAISAVLATETARGWLKEGQDGNG